MLSTEPAALVPLYGSPT